MLAEGEVTRFIALFHSTLPERIGPIRSARPYFIDLANGYDALFVTHGWSPEAEQMLTEGQADYLNGLYYDGTLFERSTEREAPHNSYITFEHIFSGLEEQGYNVTGQVDPLEFYQDDDFRIEGEAGKEVMINYHSLNQVRYEYEESSAVYHRYNGEEQSVDHDSGSPVELSNVVVIEAKHDVIDNSGRRKVDLESGGKALLLQNGIASEVQWQNQNGRLVPVEDGKVVPLNKGRTWINIIPESPGIDGSVSWVNHKEG